MNTLVKNYSLDKPITALDFIVLAGKTGLKKVDLKYNDYTSEILESLLKKYGPLWCAGTWYGGGHIIVLTGVDKEKFF